MFQIKSKRTKRQINKSIYISEELYQKVKKLAKDNETSINYVIVSIIDYCLNEMETNDS